MSARHSGLRRRVLIIDDDAFLLGAMSHQLYRRFDVTTIASPRRALEALEAGEFFDGILWDTRVAEMPGEEFRERVGEVNAPAAARVVLMAAEDRAGTPGVRLHVPFDLHDLESALDEVNDLARVA